MRDTTLQLTIRGLDPKTKQALVKKANQQGVSLNRYALRSLEQSAGIDSTESRYQAIKQFLGTHNMQAADRKAFDDAIKWSDKASIEKQHREERDAGI